MRHCERSAALILPGAQIERSNEARRVNYMDVIYNLPQTTQVAKRDCHAIKRLAMTGRYKGCCRHCDPYKDEVIRAMQDAIAEGRSTNYAGRKIERSNETRRVNYMDVIYNLQKRLNGLRGQTP